MKKECLNKPILCLLGILTMLLMGACTRSDPLFQRLTSDKTGITFSNTIVESDSLNIINHTNMYNGGGVGIADFNNDGLQDIYFTGLMVDNELYLNQGGFKFRNVTRQANVAARNRWSSGVAVIDINSDGLMDIYVCATTNNEAVQRTSLLYINQGVNEDNIPVFKDMTEEYNLDFSGHTTMAAFFDYDNDEDLDLYLMVNQFNRNNSMNRFSTNVGNQASETRDRLFRNEGADSLGHPYFRDVSDAAGITEEGFGLGLNITDINRDGWKDVYVANDFYTNDLLYINNGDGTFTDKSSRVFKHTAYAAMGNDVADLNNDSYPEVLVVDMRPDDSYRKKKMLEPNDYSSYLRHKRDNYDNQLVRNVLQVYQGNHPVTGDPLYSDVGIYAGIAETDWSWAPLMVDFDNDGWRDMMITNGFPKGMNDNDFEEIFDLYPRYISQEELLPKIPPIKISNYIYRNNGEGAEGKNGLTFEDVTEQWGMDIPSFSNGAAHVDLNNDGALDIVINNTNQPAFIFRNRLAEIHSQRNNFIRIKLEGSGENTLGLGAHVEIEYDDGKNQYHEHTLYRGYESSVEPIVHFGLGDSTLVDKLTVTWPDSTIQVIRDVKPNQVLTVKQEGATDIPKDKRAQATREPPLLNEVTDEIGFEYMHEEWDFNDFNIQPLLPHKLSQYGPGLAVGDVNGDELVDIHISGSFDHKGQLLIQQKDGTFTKEGDLLVGSSSQSREEEMGSLFFDADGDGDDDLYIVSGSYEHTPGDRAYQDRFFVNAGGKFRLDEEALPSFLSSGSVVRASDFDRDGDLDLFVGGRVEPHQYPKPVDSYILRNTKQDGQVKFEIANDEVAPILNEIGMISDALWTDFNNDGWIDLILTGEWMSLRFLKNESGTLTDITDETGIANYKGWWNSLCGGDFDRDGDTDYIAGNLGTNTYFQGNDQYPVKVYANDFDNNGVFDMIPSVYMKSQDGNKVEVPYHGRRNLMQQIPSIEEKFETFQEFAVTPMSDLLARFESSGMLTYQANHMESSYIENVGDGHFEITPLPDKVQWAPVFGCATQDLNNDGITDVLLTGNDHGMELSTGKADALNGLVLMGNGDGTFNILDFEQSGFFVPGDAKALITLTDARNNLVVMASQNRGELKSFKKKNVNKRVQIRDDDASALIYFENGTVKKKEFYYGSGFLSQSGRYLLSPDNVQKIEITNFRGDVRTIDF